MNVYTKLIRYDKSGKCVTHNYIGMLPIEVIDKKKKEKEE